MWPWNTLTEWMDGSLKSHRRKVVSREEVTTSRWVGCVQQCVSSWSCPTTKDNESQHHPPQAPSYSDTSVETQESKKASKSPLLTLAVKADARRRPLTARGVTVGPLPSAPGRPSACALAGSMSVRAADLMVKSLTDLFKGLSM